MGTSGAPGMLREMKEEIDTIHDFVVQHSAEHTAAAELVKVQKIPERVRVIEDRMKYAMGFMGGILAIETVRGIVDFVVPTVVVAFGGGK